MRDLLEKEQSIYEELLKQINFSVFGNRACREIISLVDDLIDEIYKNDNEEENMENRINKLKGYRVMIGKTQEEMAQVIGVTRETYINKENGKTKLTVNEAVAIVKLLKSCGIETDVEELY